MHLNFHSNSSNSNHSKRFIVFLLVVTGFTLGCQVTDQTNKNIEDLNIEELRGIYGGQEAADFDPVLKSTVAFGDGHEGYCSATLLSRQHAVTAAHCINGFNRFIHFGKNSFESEVREVSKTVIHPEYHVDRNPEPDLAILKFKGGLPSGFQPVELMPKSVRLNKGDSLLIAGYGTTGRVYGGSEGAGLLHKVNLKISYMERGSPTLFLGQNDLRGACTGDSGGSVYYTKGRKYYLAGVIGSVGTTEPDSNDVSLCGEEMWAASATFFRSWILSRLRE